MADSFAIDWIMEDIGHKLDPRQFGCKNGQVDDRCLGQPPIHYVKSTDASKTIIYICTIVTADFA